LKDASPAAKISEFAQHAALAGRGYGAIIALPVNGRLTMTGKSQHVFPRGNRWSVRKSGSARATAIFDTQKEAIEKARELAQAQKTTLFIFGSDGLIKKRIPYGDDPHPPKG
jgi:hypothetical protein